MSATFPSPEAVGRTLAGGSDAGAYDGLHRPPPPTWAGLVERGWTRAEAFADRAAELAAVRSVSAMDLGLGRIFDGHRNAVERLLVHRPGDVPEDERRRIAGGTVALGVWGADPHPGEGPPAVLVDGAAHPHGVLHGVKTFCSGAGLVERALVLARSEPGAPPSLLVHVDLTAPGTVEIDRTWFAAPALRSSESHRVVFRSAPVLAVLGPPGALAEEPWFSGDALRTAASWCGALDAVAAGVHAALRARPASDAEALLLGRLAAAHATAERWLEHAASALDRARPDAPDRVVMARMQIADRAREVLRLAAELAGSYPIATDTHGAGARRDLDLLLLQHRLTPAAVRLGRAFLDRS